MGRSTPTFDSKAPWIMDQLVKDFDLTRNQAAGILGNLGHESNGFTQLQEVHPLGGGRGGLGWAQWTGPRRVAFEDYCARNKLSPTSDKANYGYLFTELKGPYKKTISDLRETATTQEAVKVFEQGFERAGVKNYPSRFAWATRATRAHGHKDEGVAQVQTRLHDLGLKTIVGDIDGINGPRTKEAITAFQLCHGMLIVDGIAGPETRKAMGL